MSALGVMSSGTALGVNTLRSSSSWLEAAVDVEEARQRESAVSDPHRRHTPRLAAAAAARAQCHTPMHKLRT